MSKAADTLLALRDLNEVWDRDTAYDIGPHLTCREAEALAAVFEAAGIEGLAAALMYGHASEDEEGDEHYQEEEA